METKSKLEIQDIVFQASYGKGNAFPDDRERVQLAFCGRSNAGKSSLINAIVNRKNLVKVSSTPGKTRTLNFFLLNEKLFLVDLPGFGYAKASHTERDDMMDVTNYYLNKCKALKVLFVLCDSARTLPEEEKDVIETCFDRGIKPVLVRTKVDKLNASERDKLRKECKIHNLDFRGLKIIRSSIKNNLGIEEIRGIIASFLPES